MAKLSSSDIQTIAIASAVAAVAGAIASAIVAAFIAKASEKRTQESTQATIWNILGEQQQSVGSYGRSYARGGRLRRSVRLDGQPF